MKAKFKISQLAAADTATVELLHPKHGPTGIMVTLAGPTHPAWKEALKAFRESKQTDEDNTVLLAATIIGWDEEAMEVKHTPENVLRVLKTPANVWLLNFLSQKILDNTTFFP